MTIQTTTLSVTLHSRRPSIGLEVGLLTAATIAIDAVMLILVFTALTPISIWNNLDAQRSAETMLTIIHTHATMEIVTLMMDATTASRLVIGHAREGLLRAGRD